MKALIILNDPPYGTERSYNGLRLALALTKTEGTELRIFVMADAVACAKAGQKTPEGYYNLERMLRGLAAKEVPVGACGTCMDARGHDRRTWWRARTARPWPSSRNGPSGLKRW